MSSARDNVGNIIALKLQPFEIFNLFGVTCVVKLDFFLPQLTLSAVEALPEQLMSQAAVLDLELMFCTCISIYYMLP